MKTLLRCAIISIILALTGCYAIPFNPATPTPMPQPGAYPPGNYQDTCQNCHIDGHRLYCSCQNKNQMLISTSLAHAWGCRDIQNIDGRLNCMSRQHHRPRQPRPPQHHGHRLPPGNYQDSCQNCYVDGHRLYCSCQNKNQMLISTSLAHARDCRDIQNIDGRLNCS